MRHRHDHCQIRPVYGKSLGRDLGLSYRTLRSWEQQGQLTRLAERLTEVGQTLMQPM